MSRMMSIIPSSGIGNITVATVGDLPATGILGQFALVLADNSVYVWDGTQWVLVGGQGNLLGHAGTTAITNGLQTCAVTFAAMPDTTYSITATIENTVDADPIYLEIVATTKSTTGFTAEFNAPADSANYILNWKVARAV